MLFLLYQYSQAIMNCLVLYSSILFGTLEADAVSFKKSISKLGRTGWYVFGRNQGVNVMVSNSKFRNILGKSKIVLESEKGHSDRWNGPITFPKRSMLRF